MFINPSRLKYPISIVSVGETQDQYGDLTDTETLVCNTRADTFTKAHSELVDNDRMINVITRRFFIRFNPNVNTDNIIIYRNERYKILSMIPSGLNERQYLEIDAELIK